MQTNKLKNVIYAGRYNNDYCRNFTFIESLKKNNTTVYEINLIKLSKKAVIDVPKLETFIKGIQDRITYMDFESKRLALEMLDITIWLDGENAEITGVIDPEYAIVTKQT